MSEISSYRIPIKMIHALGMKLARGLFVLIEGMHYRVPLKM